MPHLPMTEEAKRPDVEPETATVTEGVLATLARKHGTDKWDSHWYAKHYERHFSHLRTQPIRLLEIGIGGYEDPHAGGQSLRMWKEFFPHAQIVGLDIFDKSPHREERIETYQGSEVDLGLLRTIVERSGPFDIIVDDGSHRCDHVIATFEFLFEHGLKSDGIYAAEDLQTSYWSSFGGSSALDNTFSSMAYFKRLCDRLNWVEWHRPGYQATHLDLHVTSMHFYHGLVFVEKGQNNEESTIVKNNVVPLGYRSALRARARAAVLKSAKLVAGLGSRVLGGKKRQR